ncbi:MAG: hypothetical protein J6W04_05620 [Bacteroidales bacterium]|nr:hypothetical protein [Bacteroidales bacterium]
MRRHYYVINGLCPWSEEDEKKIDSLLPKDFTGNAIEKLMEKGYTLDENGFYTPEGKKVCNMTTAN